MHMNCRAINVGYAHCIADSTACIAISFDAVCYPSASHSSRLVEHVVQQCLDVQALLLLQNRVHWSQ